VSVKRAGDGKAAQRSADIWRSSLLVWAMLMLLVLLTLGLAYLPLGRFNMPLALLIAAAKALLIGVVFMELRLAKSFIRLAAGAAFLWIAVMFALTFSDLASRAG
jgi:cytochrome c oxidase subunit 4